MGQKSLGWREKEKGWVMDAMDCLQGALPRKSMCGRMGTSFCLLLLWLLSEPYRTHGSMAPQQDNSCKALES